MNQRSRIDSLVCWAVLGLALFFALIPLLWGFSTALKQPSAAESFPPQWLPHPVTFDNFISVLFGSNMTRYLLNSLIVGVFSIAVTLTVAAHAGYSAARFRFSGKKQILFLILSTTMLPVICILVPVYLLVTYVNLHNSYLALVLVYSAWQVPTATWIMRGFFESIPTELEEAALIDGTTRLGAFYRIILPLSQPGLAAVGILVFVYVWNDFLIAFTLTISNDMRLVQSGLYFFVTESGIEWSRLMAAVVLALIPPIATFILLQSRFIQGLTSGTLK